ncbi:MAG: MFS transporter [Microgenomates group bacterium]
MQRNITIAYIVSTFRNAWFWLGVWILWYLSITNYSGIGIVESTLFFTAIILEIPTGALADILGKKKTIIISFFLSGLCNLGIAYSSNLYHLLFSVVLGGIGMSFYSGAFDALVYDSLLQEKKEANFHKILSRITSQQLVMMAICSVVGGYLYSYHPRLPFILCGIFAFAASGISFLFTEPERDTEKFSFSNYLRQNTEGFKHLFNQNILRFVVFLIIISSFYALSDEMLDSMLGFEFGLSSQMLGILFSVIALVGALFSYISGKFSQGRDLFYLILILSGVSALTYLLSPLAGVVLGSILLISRSAIMAVYGNYQSSLLNKHIDSKYRATALSSFNLIKTLPYAISAPFLGIYMQQITARNFAFFVGILIAIVVIFQSIAKKTSS